MGDVKLANRIYLISMVLMFVVQLLFSVILGIMPKAISTFFSDTIIGSNLLVAIVQFLSLTLPVTYFIIVLSKRKNIKQLLKINPLSFSQVIIIILLTIAASGFTKIIGIPFYYFVELIGFKDVGLAPQVVTLFDLIIGTLTIAILPAINEELLMRGLLLGNYQKYSQQKAIVITAFLFAISHFNLAGFFIYFSLGIFLGLIVIRTKSIFAGIVAHATYNFLSLFLVYLGVADVAENSEPSSLLVVVGFLFLLSAAAFIPMMIWFYKSTSHMPLNIDGSSLNTDNGSININENSLNTDSGYIDENLKPVNLGKSVLLSKQVLVVMALFIILHALMLFYGNL